MKGYPWTKDPPCKFRFQCAERHAWCECGRWEVMTSAYPDRAQQKKYWQDEHIKGKANHGETCTECQADVLNGCFDGCSIGAEAQ